MKYFSGIITTPRLNQFAFYSLLGSGAYIILLWSPNVLGHYFSRWTKVIIYLFPWLTLWVVYSWQVVTTREHRLEIILIVSILILGVLNTYFSDSVTKSLAPMRTFLLTGIFALWTSMLLLTDQRRRQIFDWFCCACLAIIVPVELIIRGMRGPHGSGVFEVFILNPIPLGTLIILLSPGFLRLLLSPHFKVKIGGWLLLSLGAALLLITTKRGSLLAVVAMLLGLRFLRGRRLRYLACTVLLAVGLLVVFQGRRLVACLDPNIPSQFTILHRLEMYPLAMHIWQHHPVMGIGLRPSTHQNYLADYQQRIQKLQDFPKTVTDLQTFDNMMVTGFVELGTIITLLYLVLVIFIIVRYCRAVRVSPDSAIMDWYRLLVVLGFAVHSLSYDSLLFPPVNWLFHVQVGIMAGYHALETGRGWVINPTP